MVVITSPPQIGVGFSILLLLFAYKIKKHHSLGIKRMTPFLSSKNHLYYLFLTGFHLPKITPAIIEPITMAMI